jgi:hypothetical protein
VSGAHLDRSVIAWWRRRRGRGKWCQGPDDHSQSSPTDLTTGVDTKRERPSKTSSGKWNYRLTKAAVVFFAIALVEIIFHQTGGHTLTDNLWLGIPMVCAGICIALAAYPT